MCLIRVGRVGCEKNALVVLMFSLPPFPLSPFPTLFPPLFPFNRRIRFNSQTRYQYTWAYTMVLF